ncbi:MAG: hypothetical protein K2Y32_08830 [Candidatus Obscuribacterales bacterium]|nr:hypothetical protein [Candidatus Obscuribacterales bacterium]
MVETNGSPKKPAKTRKALADSISISNRNIGVFTKLTDKPNCAAESQYSHTYLWQKQPSLLSFAVNLCVTLGTTFATTCAIVNMTTAPAFASAYSSAKEQFDRADYKGAAATLRAAMYKGAENNAPSWLLLAKSYAKLGESGACKQTLSIISKHFPASKEAKEAESLLASYGSTAAGTSGKASSPASGNSNIGPNTSQAANLEDRITIIPARFGHAPVDRRTVGIVRDVVKKLPPNIYKILDRGGAQIFVTPNLIDKFPDAVQAKHPTLGHYLSEEFGRTYGKDIYICERISSEPGATDLQAPLHEETIRATTYTQLSHALDCCLEMLSKDAQYLKLYRQDVADSESSSAEDLRLYMSKDENGAKETFSGLVAGMMGANTHITRFLESNFPRAKAWIKARIELLSK